jgi:hypothetical protein
LSTPSFIQAFVFVFWFWRDFPRSEKTGRCAVTGGNSIDKELNFGVCVISIGLGSSWVL